MATPLHKSKLRRTRTRNSLLVDATEGNKDALLSSLDARAAVDERDCFFMTPLMHAAKNGHLDCVRLLIGRGANVHKRSDNCLTAAHHAALAGNSEVLLALFDAGVAADVMDGYNERTPLMCACLKGRTQCVLSLLGHGADVHKAASDGMTAAHYAAFGGNSEMLCAILDAGVAVDVTDSNLMTPLMCAACQGCLECLLLLLLQRGADVRHRRVDGRTAAHYAAERGNVEMLRAFLIASGADLLPLAGCNTVVDSACVTSQVDAASFALACGCRFALTCRELESKNYGYFRRVALGLSSINCAL